MDTPLPPSQTECSPGHIRQQEEGVVLTGFTPLVPLQQTEPQAPGEEAPSPSLPRSLTPDRSLTVVPRIYYPPEETQDPTKGKRREKRATLGN